MDERSKENLLSRDLGALYGMIERFFRTTKKECIWHHNFKSIKEANETITRWIGFYNWERRHSALQYRTPSEAFRLAA